MQITMKTTLICCSYDDAKYEYHSLVDRQGESSGGAEGEAERTEWFATILLFSDGPIYRYRCDHKVKK